ncbi:hypothetical protein H4R24_005383, partial [Coemansia sp. RSA 988]
MSSDSLSSSDNPNKATVQPPLNEDSGELSIVKLLQALVNGQTARDEKRDKEQSE